MESKGCKRFATTEAEIGEKRFSVRVLYCHLHSDFSASAV
jgi:hypothetical protein